MKKQETLFAEPQVRDTRGRFCTKEKALYERTLSENARLRYECEKYRRAYIAVSQDNSRLTREMEELKQELSSLLHKL